MSPAQSRAWLALAQLRNNALQPDDVAALAQLLERERRPAARANFAHALAKSYEDHGDFEKAAAILAPAKATVRAAGYEVASERILFEAAKASTPQPVN